MHNPLDVTPTPNPCPQGGGECAHAAFDSICGERGHEQGRHYTLMRISGSRSSSPANV
jgi:hypothetical protein